MLLLLVCLLVPSPFFVFVLFCFFFRSFSACLSRMSRSSLFDLVGQTIRLVRFRFFPFFFSTAD